MPQCWSQGPLLHRTHRFFLQGWPKLSPVIIALTHGGMARLSGLNIQGSPKIKPPPIFQKIVLKIANVKLKYESSTIIQSVGNKYYMRDLLLRRHQQCPARKVAICVTCSEWCRRSLWHQLALASCKFHSKIFF